MEQIFTGLLFLNVLLLAIMLMRTGQAVRLLKKQAERIEDMSAATQKEDHQIKSNVSDKQAHNASEQKREDGQEVTLTNSVEKCDDQSLQGQEKENLINEVLSEIFS